MENKEKFCPNLLYDSNNISIGEFKTLKECMEFPIHGIWCVNRDDDNLFEKYKSNGYRILIICSWNRGDRWRFVIALIKGALVSYYDLNDLPMDLVYEQYEQTLGDEALSVIKGITENINSNRIMNKNKIRLTESQLHTVIKESIKSVLIEGINKHDYVTNNGRTNNIVEGLFYGFNLNHPLANLYDALVKVQREHLDNILDASRRYETLSNLQPRLEEVERLLKQATKLVDTCYIGD